MRESAYVKNVLKPDLTREFPGIEIRKQDPLLTYQGVPDLLLLFRNRWATLETKRASNSALQPNQDHHVERLNDMSYAAFACPSNHDQIMDDLKKVFYG